MSPLRCGKIRYMFFVYTGIAFFILYLAWGFVWQFRIVPKRRKKGQLPRSFSRATVEYCQKVIRDKSSKLNYTLFYHLPLLLCFIIAWGLWGFGKIQFYWALLVMFSAVILSYFRCVIGQKAENRRLANVFQVAQSNFHYPNWKELQLNPINVIDVKEWLDCGLGKTVITLPASFDSSLGNRWGRSKFESHFSATAGDLSKVAYLFDWQPAQNKVVITPTKALPTMVDYDAEKCKEFGPYEIPLGLGQDGNIITWDTEQIPQALFVGMTGSGKSTTQRVILYHIFVAHPDYWKFYGIDMKMVELPKYNGYPNFAGCAVTYEEAYEILKEAREVMMDRFTAMKEARVDHIDKMEGDHRAIMVMIDESNQLLAPNKGAGLTPEIREEESIKGMCRHMIQEITQLGRAAKVHCCIATQRAAVESIGGGTIKANCGFRIGLGAMDSLASQMVFDTDGGKNIPPNIKGRGIIAREVGNEMPFQSFILPEGALDTTGTGGDDLGDGDDLLTNVSWDSDSGEDVVDSEDLDEVASLGDMISGLDRDMNSEKIEEDGGGEEVVMLSDTDLEGIEW